MLHAQQEHFQVCERTDAQRQEEEAREVEEGKDTKLTISIFENDFVVLKKQL